MRTYGVEVSPDCIVVTTGSSSAMLLAFAALLDAGDRVLVTDPGYPCYPKFIRVLDAVPLAVPVSEQDGFQYSLPAVKAALKEGVRALVLNSPANPTGTLTSPRRMRELLDLWGARVGVVSDEIYHGLTYGERARSVLEYSSHAIVINGFSKLFAMTGWRLGYAVFPRVLIRPVQRIQQNLFISAPDFAQLAAIAALTQAQGEVESMCREYDRRRRFVLKRLAQMGMRVCVEPTGAFYVFVNVQAYTDNVYRFAFQILEEAGVAVTPGVDFGAHGEGFIRICYASSMADLASGMDRLESFFRTRNGGQETGGDQSRPG
jgi:aspartate/methionine/tyrosine aminotransferase